MGTIIIEVFSENIAFLLKKAGYNTIEDLHNVSANQIYRIPWIKKSDAFAIVEQVARSVMKQKNVTFSRIVPTSDKIQNELAGRITAQMIIDRLKDKDRNCK